MARVAVQLTNFTGGELSPRLDGRNDLAKYASGCKTLQNMIVYPHGSAARRSGTSFVAEVENSAEKTRLIPFEFSTTQTYILEFGNEYIRFYKDGGAILEANKTITGITQANPGVVSITSHGFSNGDTIVIDRTEDPKDGDLVILTDKTYFKLREYKGQKNLWGKVTWVLKKM